MSLALDVSRFSQAIAQYVRETGRDSAEVLNRKAASMFFAASRAAPRATAARLRQKAREPRYVAALLRRKGHYTREDARAYSAALAKRFARAVGFLRAYLRSCGSAILGRGGPVRARGVVCAVQLAREGRLAIRAATSYAFRRRREGPGVFESLLEDFLRQGVQAETSDTLAHLTKRMAGRAREHSAK